MKRPLLRSLALASVLLLGACGDVNNESAVSANEASAQGSEGVAESDAAAESGESRSVIDEFLGIDQSLETFDMQLQEQQRVIAGCMQDLGWEYEQVRTPNLLDLGRADPNLAIGSDAWLATYGLGITTQAFGQSQVGPDLVGLDDSNAVEYYIALVRGDPNTTYVEGLSAEQQQAYEVDLWGADLSTGGCSAVGFGGPAHEFFSIYESELNSIFEQTQNHPRVLQSGRELADCLSESGYVLSGVGYTSEQIADLLWTDLGPLQQEVIEASQAVQAQGLGVDAEELNEAELRVALASENLSGVELSAEQRTILAELQDKERQLALEVEECSPGYAATQEFGSVFVEVRNELEQNFLDENAEAVERFENGG